MGLRKDLKRNVLGVYNIPVETSEGWQYVLKNLKQRGLKKVLMFIADGLPGLKDIIYHEFPESKFQRCLVHKTRNIILKVRSDDKKIIAEDFRKVFVLENANYKLDQAKVNLTNFIDKWSKKYYNIKF